MEFGFNRSATIGRIYVVVRIRGVTIMRYINLHFTYLLTYCLDQRPPSACPLVTRCYRQKRLNHFLARVKFQFT